jgi:hypothetical protein
MKKNDIFFLMLLVALLSVPVVPCFAQQVIPAAPDNSSKPQASAGLPAPELPRDRYNDVALYISGMKLSDTSGLYSLTKNAAWINYASVTGGTWKHFSDTKIKKITDWVQAEMPDISRDCRTLFYPFSGPDFLYAHAFFPHADTYLLVGLEPVGSVPEPEKLQGATLGAFFRMLDLSISDALTLSFFRTNDMADEINHKLITGTVPVLMLFLSRTGNHIADMRFFDLQDNGTIAYRDAGPGNACNKNAARGVEVAFSGKGDTHLRRLIYISADISDKGLARRSTVQSFLQHLPPDITTYVKSASYLMHKNYFSTMRSLILEKSSAVVQDDSAIPYRFFDQGTWDIRLYGTYSGPIELFKVHLEKDLKEAYSRDSKKLGFRLGYANQSNVLVARKKAQAQP